MNCAWFNEKFTTFVYYMHHWQALHVLPNNFYKQEISRNFDFFGLIFHLVPAVKNLSSGTITKKNRVITDEMV